MTALLRRLAGGLLSAALLIGGSTSSQAAPGQDPPPRIFPDPDSTGEVVIAQPKYQGVRAAAPIPPALHIRNEGGSDGAGLCVYASMVMAGAWQQVADLTGLKSSALWRYVKARPGGSYPSKLTEDVQTVYGDSARIVNYNGQDDTVLETLARQRKPFGITFGTGRNYNYARIPHMVDGLHYERNGWACILDNNFPGVYSWMPASELKRRAEMLDGSFWAAWWEGDMPGGGDDPSADRAGLDLDTIVLVVIALVPAIVLSVYRNRKGTDARPGLRIAA